MEIVMYTDNDRHRYRIIKKLPEIGTEIHSRYFRDRIYVIDKIVKREDFEKTDEEYKLQKDYEFYVIYYRCESGKERQRERDLDNKGFCAIEKNKKGFKNKQIRL